MLLSLWIAMSLFISACDESRKQETAIIQIEGALWACNVNTSYAVFGAYTENEDLPELSLPASEGDLLYMLYEDLQFYYRYSPENGIRYTISFDTLNTRRVYMNGQLSYMELSGPTSMEAFQELTEAEIAQLHSLNISLNPPEDVISLLKQHEGSLQGIGLILEDSDGSGNCRDLLSTLRPNYLVIDDSWGLPDPEENISLASLELLWMEGNISSLAKLARCCSNLESLIIAGWEPGQGELLPLSDLNKLKCITIAESSLTTLSSLEFPEALHSLNLISCDSLNNIDKLRELDKLSELSLAQCYNLEDLDVLEELETLRRISFPPNISHNEFRRLTESLNHLEIVEFIECPEIEDLSPLQALPELEILLLQLEEDQLGGLDSLQQLELLVLTYDVFEDNPEWIKELRASLPDTKIVPGSGICLGSGWLLLLLPFILLFRYFIRSKK
jgi:hypothetical protein